MSWPLPPKRYEQVDDPRFDPIRGRPWFADLAERREKLNKLSMADKEAGNKWGDQTIACMKWGVSDRELRDYRDFIRGISPSPITRNQQAILDRAYEDYCKLRAVKTFRFCLSLEAPLWGEKARHVVERWEVDPNYWPTVYKFRPKRA